MGSVSRHLASVKRGDPAALELLWRRYYPQLLNLARSRLRGFGIRHADEEDVVVAAFDAFYRAASQGKYPGLCDRHGLWRMLLTITANNARDVIRKEHSAARGGGRVLDQSVLNRNFEAETDAGLEQLISSEPTPAFAALLAESYGERLRSLNDDVLQRVAVLKLEGFENREIAGQLQFTERTVERKLALIRKAWSAGGDGSSNADH